MAERLREHGLEVDGFLVDCDEFIAVLEGRQDGVALLAKRVHFLR